jgi:hypothetical protein
MQFEDILIEPTWTECGIYSEIMSGWTRFQPELAAVEDCDELCKMLAFEVNTRQREMIIRRIIQKYNSIKQKQMEELLNDYFYRKRYEATSVREDSRAVPYTGGKQVRGNSIQIQQRKPSSRS